MNYIAPAPVSPNLAFKTPYGSARNAPSNNGNEAKFQLPVKKSDMSNDQKEKTVDNAPASKNTAPEHSGSRPSHTLDKGLNSDETPHEASREMNEDNAPTTGFENAHLISQELILGQQNPQIHYNAATRKIENQNLNMSDNINKAAIAHALDVPFNKQSNSNLLQKNGLLPDNLNSSDANTQEIEFISEKALNNASGDDNSQSKDKRSQFINVPIADKNGTKIEGVDLLQARSFPAISTASTASAPSANGHNIAEAILKSQQSSIASGVASGVAAGVQNPDPVYSTNQPKALHTLKIQLHPAELGVVTAIMKLSGDDLHVQLRVDNIDAFRLLSDDSSSIVKAIRGQGFSIEQINIQLSSSDRGPGQQGNQQQNGQNNNPFLQSHSNSDQMNNQNNPDHNNQSANSGNHDDGSIDRDNDGLPKSHVTTLSDGVYL